MTMAMIVCGVLGATVLAAWWRLYRGRADAAAWRIALLALGQPVMAGLLFLTLYPPPVASPGERSLTIATQNTPRGALVVPDADLVALPEAPAPPGIASAPDLATALRRHPGVGRLRIIGDGLTARDVGAARGLAVAFDPRPLPRGLVALTSPAGAVAVGGEFRIGGTAAGMRGTAELRDPGDARVAIVPLDRDGRFVLTGSARVAGPALFRVRLADAGGRTIEEAAVPVVATADPPPHVLFLAGAPGPEVKYWRRWAVDAGLTVTTRQAVGAGLMLGDPVPPLSAATLARYDLVIVDERSWAGLGAGERVALAAAVRGGLGLLLRATGPLPSDLRAGFAALGVTLDAGATTATVASRDATEPALTRRVLPLAAPTLVPVLRDAGGAVLAGWHGTGRGRIGIWSVADDFALVTSGHGDRFGIWWADMVGALARARSASAVRITPLPQAGQRMAICGAGATAEVLPPDRHAVALLPDAAANGCAGYWPREAGWHLLRHPGAVPFYVCPATALPGVRASDRRDATLALASADMQALPGTPMRRPGASWPWLIAFLLVASGLWYLERARLGRRQGASTLPVPSAARSSSAGFAAL